MLVWAAVPLVTPGSFRSRRRPAASAPAGARSVPDLIAGGCARGGSGPLPLAVVAGRLEAQSDVDAEHVIVFGGVVGQDAPDCGVGLLQQAQVADLDEHAKPVAAVARRDEGIVLVGQPWLVGCCL